MTICELCDMDLAWCQHGLQRKKEGAAAAVDHLLISPAGRAHFPGCPHKGDEDLDYSRWAELDVARAWERLGAGERLQATGGARRNLVAAERCRDCLAHGPW